MIINYYLVPSEFTSKIHLRGWDTDNCISIDECLIGNCHLESAPKILYIGWF